MPDVFRCPDSQGQIPCKPLKFPHLALAFLRSFRGIIIHPRCKRTLEEAQLYSYKKDRLTGDILPTILDKHNHMWDAVRYALEPMIGGNESRSKCHEGLHCGGL